MKNPMRARSARSGAVAVAVALAVAGGGLAYGSSADDGGVSTRGAQTAKAAPPGTAPVGGTASMQPKRGVKPSVIVPKGSTRDARPSVDRNPGAKATTVVDKSDRGVKGTRATKDRGRKNAPATRDLGAR